MIIVVLVAALVVLLIERFGSGLIGGQGQERDRSIAVLPFVDMSEAGDQEYFSDGVTEEILNSLASLKQLRVAGRTSSFAFKGRNDDLRRIGEVLGVAYIVEGSVRRVKDRIRVTAQLIEVDGGFHRVKEVVPEALFVERTHTLARHIASKFAQGICQGKGDFCRQIEMPQEDAFTFANEATLRPMTSDDARERNRASSKRGRPGGGTPE